MGWTPPPFDTNREIRDQVPVEEWRRAIAAIAARHGLDAGDASPFASGSDVVWGTAHHVIKLTAPEWDWQIEAEARHLSFLDGRLDVATPSLIAQGEIGGWPYIVMTRVPGRAIAEIWDELPTPERLRLAEDLGRLTRGLHQLDCGDLPATWRGFWSRCTADIATRHAEDGVPPALVDQVGPFLEEVGELPSEPHVFLHTELVDQHVFVEERCGRFELSALIDFADGRVGPAEYDFPAIAEFIFRGEPGLMGPLLLGYGYEARDLDRDFAKRLMAWSLCHRYGRLRRVLSTLGPGADETLSLLGDRLYDLSLPG